LLDASDEDLLSSFARFYLPRRRPDTLRRNALVAAGNSNNPELLAPVERHLDSPDPVLAEHARWAAGRLRDSTLRASPPPA
jgi:epoxyqueuosine reductase